MATPTETGNFIKHCVGPMVLTPDGKIVLKDPEDKTAPVEVEAVKRPIAGARSLPLHIKDAFWEKFRQVA